MNQLPENFFANLDFLLDNQLYEHARRFVRSSPNYTKQDALYTFFMACITALEGGVQEAVRDFSELLDHRLLALPALAGQLCACTRQDDRDRLVYDRTLTAISQTKEASSTEGYFLCAWIYYHSGNIPEAEASLQSLYRLEPDHARALTLSAALEILTSGPTDRVKSYIDKALTLNTSEVLGSNLLLIRWHLLQNDIDRAASVFRDIYTTNEKQLPVRHINLTLLVAQGNWQGLQAAAEKLMSTEQNFILPFVYFALATVCIHKSSSWKDFEAAAVAALDRLQKLEPKNPDLWAKCCRLFTRMNGSSTVLLEKGTAILKAASLSSSNNGLCLLELAEEFLLLGRYQEARNAFERALNKPAFGFRAMIGLAKCSIAQGLVDQAAEETGRISQLTISDSEPKEPVPYFLPRSIELGYLQTRLVVLQQNTDAKTSIGSDQWTIGTFLGLLTRHAELITSARPYDLEYYLLVDPVSVLAVVTDALHFCQSEPQKQASDSPVLNQCAQLVASILRTIPGLCDLSVMLARIRYLQSDYNAASAAIEAVLESEQYGQNGNALLVGAEICAAQNQLSRSKVLLDRAVVNDFKMKENLRYLILQAQHHSASGSVTEAVSALASVVARPGISQFTSQSGHTMADRCSFFLALAALHVRTRDFPKASEVLHTAQSIFQGTSQAARVIIARAEVIQETDPRSPVVVNILSSIGPENEDHFYRAQEKLAGYYLKNGETEKYIEIYEKLGVAMKETPAASIMLGEAYLRIPQASKAFAVIQTAMKRQPENQLLEVTMGSFYTRIHLFANAVNYYEAAIKKGNKAIRLDFVKLLLKLKRYEKAEALLKEMTTNEASGFQAAYEAASASALLAKVYKATSSSEKALNAFKQSSDRLVKLLIRARRESPDSLIALSTVLTDTLENLTEIASSRREHLSTTEVLQQARSHLRENDQTKVTRLLANTFLLANETGEAFRLAKELQKADPNDHQASLILAEVAFRRKDFDMAASQYKDYFKKFPENLQQILDVIPLLMRCSQQHLVKNFLQERQQAGGNGGQRQLLSFCEGLYARYTGNVKKAVELLTPALDIPQLSAKAAKNIVEIVCNWDTELPGSQSLPSTLTSSEEVIPVCVAIAQKVKLQRDSELELLIRFLPLLSRGNKVELNETSKRVEHWEHEKSFSPIQGYILASVLLTLGQNQQALAVLRNFERATWTIEDGEYLERIWLLLAEQLDLTKRGDDVTQLIFKTMEFNRSGYLVNMFDGFHCGTQNYPKAAESFRRAFEAAGSKDFASGERYAWARLNAGNPMETIEVLDMLTRLCPEQTGNFWKSIVTMRQQALNQLLFRKDERDMRADAAGRRASRT